MSITSLNFIIFVICTVILFIVFPRKYRWISLLISSICFYLISDYKCAIFVVISSFTVWICARVISRNFEYEKKELQEAENRQQKTSIKKKNRLYRKSYLLLALIINIGILVVLKIFKYFDISALNIFYKGTPNALPIIMPLGISYYTFSIVGYLLDVYWKKYSCESNYFRFLNWTIYFPHIVQGPISRYNLLGNELKKDLPLKWNNFKFGLELILWGCFKKLVIADRLSIFVNAVFEDQGRWERFNIGTIGFITLIFDALMIYTDFSGYVDIVTGISEIFGVKLERNFDHPFMSRTVPEFWRRWHMSLGGWFKDYVYYPISVSKICKHIQKKLDGKVSDKFISIITTVIPVMCTWILTGLWHGTGIGYLLWGVYYGTLISISVLFSGNILQLQNKCGIDTKTFSYGLFQRLKIFFVFIGGRLLSKPVGFSLKLHILRSIFRDLFAGMWWTEEVFNYGLNKTNFLIIIFSVLILIIVSIMQEHFSLREKLDNQNFIFKVVVITIAFYLIFLLGIFGEQYDVGSFMYQQF